MPTKIITLNFMVTRVPVSLGTILGFSVKVGGKPLSAAAAFSAGLSATAFSGSAGFLPPSPSSPAVRKKYVKIFC